MGFFGVIAVMISVLAAASTHHEHHHHRAGEHDQTQKNRRGGGAKRERSDGNGDQRRRVPHHMLTFHEKSPLFKVVGVNTASVAGRRTSKLGDGDRKPLPLLIKSLAAALCEAPMQRSDTKDVEAPPGPCGVSA
jgi:hypothetical protein